MPAHVMEKVGLEPDLLDRRPGHRPLGRPVQDRVGVGPDRSSWCRTRKWWGTPANSQSITVHIASSTEPAGAVDEHGLRAGGRAGHGDASRSSPPMTGLPGASSEVDTSDTQLQLDMASSLDSRPLARPARRDRAVDQPPGRW